MTKSKKKPALVVHLGGAEPPSTNSVEGALRAALAQHKEVPFAEVFVLGVHSGRAHTIGASFFHYSRDRVRMLGALHWAIAHFTRKYFP